MKSKKLEQGEKLVQRHYPVVTKSGWLPTGLWPELDQCHERHEAAVKQLRETVAEAQELGVRLEKEDEERVEAYKTGLKAPKMTDPAERERITSDARAKVTGAQHALAEAVFEAVETLEKNGAAWMADLSKRAEEAEEKRDEAARLHAEANQIVAETDRLMQWVGRSSGRNERLARFGHIPLDSMPLPTRGGVGKPAGPKTADLLAELPRV